MGESYIENIQIESEVNIMTNFVVEFPLKIENIHNSTESADTTLSENDSASNNFCDLMDVTDLMDDIEMEDKC